MSVASASPVDALRRIELGQGAVALLRLGQSGVALRLAERTVLVDPFLSPRADRLVPPPFAPETVRSIDLVLVTHDHPDHLDERALPALAAASPSCRVVVPEDLVARVASLGVESERIVGLTSTGRLQDEGLTVHAVPACHGDRPSDAYRLGPFLGYVVEGAGVRVYHAGDTILFPGLIRRLRAIGVDLALLPINGRDAERESRGIVGNLDAGEAAEVAAAARADAVVPLHWDMFAANAGDPAALVRAATTTVMLPILLRPFVYTSPRRPSRDERAAGRTARAASRS